MQRLKLLGTFLTASCLVIATIASAEPVSTKPTAKKHAECQGTKVKTACNQAADVKDFVTSRQVPSTSGPTDGGQQTSASKTQQDLQSAKDDSAQPQQKLDEARELLARAELVRTNYAPVAGQPTRAELDASIDQIKNDLDSMSEMGEMESLRLQMAMDRMSKMMSTLSNLLKKISDTQNSIVQNIK